MPLEDEVGSVLEQLAAKKGKLQLDAFGHKIALTNLDKPLWPKHGRRRALTKRDPGFYPMYTMEGRWRHEGEA